MKKLYKNKVSIIVPIYNVEAYLERCLESIIRQSYWYIEVILVDDGSEDKSGMICEMYAKKDSRLKVIHKTNGGLSDARNVGIDACTGDFLFFLDSDDFIQEHTIEIMLDAAVRYSADIVECGVQYFYQDNVDWDSDENTEKVYDGNQILYSILNYDFKIMAWNKLYRRYLFDTIRFPKGKINEDEFTVPYVVEKCNKYVVINKKCYGYYQRTGSIMNSYFSEKNLEVMEILKNRYTYFKKKYDGRYDEVILYHFLCTCTYLKVKAKKNAANKKIIAIIDKEIENVYSELITNKNITQKIKYKAIITKMLPKITFRIRQFKNEK